MVAASRTQSLAKHSSDCVFIGSNQIFHGQSHQSFPISEFLRHMDLGNRNFMTGPDGFLGSAYTFYRWNIAQNSITCSAQISGYCGLPERHMGSLSVGHWLVVLVIVLVLFGRGRISEIMGDFGKGLSSFRKGLVEGDEPATKPLSPPSLLSPSTDPQPVITESKPE